MIYFLLLLISMFITSCSSDDSTSGPCITALDCAYGQICVDGVCTEGTGDTGNTGDTGDTGNTGNTVDTGDTTDTGNTSDSGNSGNSGDSGDTSDDTGDPDSFDTDTADDIDDTDAGPDDDTNDEDIPEPVCGDGNKEGTEQCDNGAELNGQTKCAYGETSCTVCTASCTEEAGVTSYCGDGIETDKEAVISGEIVRFYLEDATGLVATDSSGTGNNGTVAGASWVDAKFGKGLQFNGTAENYISLAYTPPVNNFTISAWFKTETAHEIDPEADNNTTGTSGQNYIFGADNKDTEGGAGVSAGTNGISVYEHGNSYMPALAVYNGTVGNGWNHIAVTYTDRQPRIYLNGILVRTGLVSPKITVHAPTIIGAGPYGYFNGTLDHVRIFDRPLSAEEIIAAMGEKCDDGALNGTQGKCKTDCSGYDCTPGTFTFDYSGAQQTFTVPSGSGTYTIEAWGAQGQKNSAGAIAGGLGGYSKADVSVSAGDILYIFVGGGGGTGPAAGWNGGGAGGTSSCTNAQGGGGGGASDVRRNSVDLSARIIVAGGGGGAGGNRVEDCGPGAGGGGGGGYYGGGGGGSYKPVSNATGGTQSAGGTAGGGGEYQGVSGTAGVSGTGGNGGTAISNDQSNNGNGTAGGTGGGLTGGNGASNGDWTGGSGGGGSGYVNAAGNTNTSTSNAVKSGNGQIVITRTCL